MYAESIVLLAAALAAPTFLVWHAAGRQPKAGGRLRYAIAFCAILFVDLPVLTALYLIPKSTPAFGLLDLASDIALVVLAIAFGCLLAMATYEKLHKGLKCLYIYRRA
jgi:hypothetical protein